MDNQEKTTDQPAGPAEPAVAVREELASLREAVEELRQEIQQIKQTKNQSKNRVKQYKSQNKPQTEIQILLDFYVRLQLTAGLLRIGVRLPYQQRYLWDQFQNHPPIGGYHGYLIADENTSDGESRYRLFLGPEWVEGELRHLGFVPQLETRYLGRRLMHSRDYGAEYGHARSGNILTYEFDLLKGLDTSDTAPVTIPIPILNTAPKPLLRDVRGYKDGIDLGFNNLAYVLGMVEEVRAI